MSVAVVFERVVAARKKGLCVRIRVGVIGVRGIGGHWSKGVSGAYYRNLSSLRKLDGSEKEGSTGPSC